MCIVIDANTFGSVFNEKNSEHYDFQPVKDWIINGKGFIVYGGTKYKKELVKAYRYLRLFVELKKTNKAKEVICELVDQKEEEIISSTSGTACNDQHIIAIFCISKCRLFCSQDSSADKFITNNSYYQKHKRPKIYRNRNHKRLLSDGNIVKIENLI